MSRQLLSVSVVALALVSWAESEAQPPADSVCPTCAVPEAEGGAADGSASQVQCAVQAPLTSEIAEQLQLETLRAYLEQSSSVAGRFSAGGTAEAGSPAEQTEAVELELELDVGEFS